MKPVTLTILSFWVIVFMTFPKLSYGRFFPGAPNAGLRGESQPDSSKAAATEPFPFVKATYHKLEISSDELLFGNVSFGTGTEKLYIMFTVGSNCTKPTLITYGCGLGTSVTIKNRLGFSATVIAQQMRHTKDGFFRANPMGRAYIGLEYKLFPKLRIGFGPTLNVYTPNTLDNYRSDLLNGMDSYRMAQSALPNKLQMWLGGKISLKFF